MALSIAEAAEARIYLDGEYATIVRAREEQIAIAPGHSVSSGGSCWP